MGKYVNFDVCSRQALLFALESLRIGLSARDQEALIEGYQHLHIYPERRSWITETEGRRVGTGSIFENSNHQYDCNPVRK